MSNDKRLIVVDAFNAEEALKLLDRGYRIMLFKDGLSDISALAVPAGKNAERALREWREHETPDGVSMRDSIFVGPDRSVGGGRSVAEALHAVTEKVVFKRLPILPQVSEHALPVEPHEAGEVPSNQEEWDLSGGGPVS